MGTDWFCGFVIESPKLDAQDMLLAGENAEALTLALRAKGAPVDGAIAQSRPVFHAALQIGLALFTRCQKRQAILHLSCHGTPEGVAIAGVREDQVKWRELGPFVAAMSSHLQHELVVCLSTCTGFEGAAILVDEFDVKAVVGPHNEVSWSNAGVMFADFYRVLAETRDVRQAVTSMNQGYVPDDVGEPRFDIKSRTKQVTLNDLGPIRWGPFWQAVTDDRLLDAVWVPEMLGRGSQIFPGS